MRVGLTFNLRPELPGIGHAVAEATCEFDTIDTVEAIAGALSALGHDLHLIESTREAPAHLAALRPDVVFNMAEGVHGADREAQIPALLELLGIPYTGPGPWCAATTLDKRRTKEILRHRGIPTPAFAYAEKPSDLKGWDRFPAIVKPVGEGSSKGIWQSNVVASASDLRRRVSEVGQRYRQGVLVEEYIHGRELTVGMLGNAPRHILPIAEIVFPEVPSGSWAIDSFEAKWIWNSEGAGRAPYVECPTNLSPRLRRRVERVAGGAFEALECRDLARLDIRLAPDGIPYVLEINALPGLIADATEESRFPLMARVFGLSYPELIRTVFALACTRHGIDGQPADVMIELAAR